MPSRPLFARTLLFTAALVSVPVLAPAQMPAPVSQSPASPGFPNGSRSPHDDNPALTRMQEQVAKGRNEDRQKRLVQDTAHLYELASQLKDEVGKTNQNTLSIEVIKKAEEIEKLAKSVKDRMRG